jgi:ketosteroid isomerase-like protein
MPTPHHQPDQPAHLEVGGLVDLVNKATDAYIKGHIPEYLTLFDHPAECSLMAPYGGETVDNLQRDEEAIEQTSQFFASGEGWFDLQHSIGSGDLVVLAGIERQHGQVGGLPDQDWSLRVTLVFRRAAAGWELLHRHADPLVRPIPFEHCAELARGLEP